MRKSLKANAVDIQQAYMEWLCGIIDKRQRSLDGESRELATELHKIQFYDLIPNDDNRVMDGLHLRDEFAAKGRYDNYSSLNGLNCTVLEMMVALSRRMEDILFEADKGDQTARWFWLLVKNLGLKLYSPNDEDAAEKYEANCTIIRRMIERRYSESGKGGLFPLRNPKCDQRKVEIWYQMMAYIEEQCKQ